MGLSSISEGIFVINDQGISYFDSLFHFSCQVVFTPPSHKYERLRLWLTSELHQESEVIFGTNYPRPRYFDNLLKHLSYQIRIFVFRTQKVHFRTFSEMIFPPKLDLNTRRLSFVPNQADFVFAERTGGFKEDTL